MAALNFQTIVEDSGDKDDIGDDGNDSGDHLYTNKPEPAKGFRKLVVSKNDGFFKQVVPKECVLLIIQLYKEHADELSGQSNRKEKRALWAKIADEVQKHGYQMDAAQCNQKWRNMLREYTLYIERLGLTKSSQDAGNPPWYFLEMADALNESQYLSVVDAEAAVDSSTGTESTFTVVPVASSLALSGSLLEEQSNSGGTTKYRRIAPAPESGSRMAADSENDSKKRKRMRADLDLDVLGENKIVKAIQEAEIARREDEESRHFSLVQELRRQHNEQMAVLNKILDALSNNSAVQ